MFSNKSPPVASEKAPYPLVFFLFGTVGMGSQTSNLEFSIFSIFQ
jgi:hypothetical protein